MNSAKNTFALLQTNPEDVYVIHLSKSPSDNRRHNYPRVCSIYTKNINSSQSEKFSLEKCASKNSISINEIGDWYDDLESYILDDFNEFLKQKENCTFIYWVEEGEELLFDLIRARFEELNKPDSSKVFTIVPHSKRISLQYLVSKSDNSKTDANINDLKTFVKHHNNDGMISGFLNSSEENVCFGKKEFASISRSVVAKTDFFISLLNKLSTTEAKKREKNDIGSIDIRSLSPWILFKKLSIASWLILIGLLSGAYGLGIWSTKWFSKSEKDLLKENESIKNEMIQQKDSLTLKINEIGDSLKIANKQNKMLNDSIKMYLKDKKLPNK